MDTYDGSGSPRYRDDDYYPPRVDSYRRRPSVSPERRRASLRPRSRSPPTTIDRYQPDDRAYDPPYDRPRERDTFRGRGSRRDRDDYYPREREFNDRERDRDRDRRRLHSPPTGSIDRYVPGQDVSRPIIRTNPMPNPLQLDFQVGFSWFAEWWRTEQAIKDDKERAHHGGRRGTGIKGERAAREDQQKERAKIQEAYDKYKAELQVKMAKLFVQQHRNEEWFKEKYTKETRDQIRKRLMEYRKNNALKLWTQDLQNGYFDEFTLEGIYKSESDGAGGVIEKEEGEATAVGETLSVQDLVPAKGGDLRDDAALHASALLIKTLAPNVARDKIEEFCRESLGEGPGGLEWLSLSDPNPTKKFHRMGWIMLKTDPEAGKEIEAIERGDDRIDIDDEEGEASKEKKSPELIVAEKALPLVNEKTIQDAMRGGFTAHVGVHFPASNPRKKALWDLFSAPERIERDLELAKRITSKFDQEMGEGGVNAVAMIGERVNALSREGKLAPPLTSSDKKKDTNHHEQNADVTMTDKPFEDQADMIPLGDTEEGEAMEVDEEDVDSPTLLAQKKELDLLIEYLRRVYNFCLFCVFEADSVHELVRKCPGGHLRRPRSGLSAIAKEAARASARGEGFPETSKIKEEKKEEEAGEEEDGVVVEEGEEVVPEKEEKEGGKERQYRTVHSRKFATKAEYQAYRAFNWVKTFEDKIFQILEPESVDITRLGGQPLDVGIETELKKYVKKEDENRFRCKVPECSKLFKAEHFWRKHIEKRHPETYNEVVEELKLVNAYVLDPGHVVPSRNDAGASGGMGAPLNGVGRGGFNLANPVLGGAAGFVPGMPFPGGWSGGPLGANGMSMGAGAASGLQAQAHAPGAVRRMGSALGNRRYGPYDRRNGGAGGAGNIPRLGNGSFAGMPGRMFLSGASRGGAAAAMYPGFPGGVPGMPGSLPPGVFTPGSGSPQAGGVMGAGAGGVVGPKEAVQGRSLKSYEDLDAVDNGGSGELDY